MLRPWSPSRRRASLELHGGAIPPCCARLRTSWKLRIADAWSRSSGIAASKAGYLSLLGLRTRRSKAARADMSNAKSSRTIPSIAFASFASGSSPAVPWRAKSLARRSRSMSAIITRYQSTALMSRFTCCHESTRPRVCPRRVQQTDRPVFTRDSPMGRNSPPRCSPTGDRLGPLWVNVRSTAVTQGVEQPEQEPRPRCRSRGHGGSEGADCAQRTGDSWMSPSVQRVQCP